MGYSKRSKTETVQKTLRIPKDIYEKIEITAIENDRDTSKQINYMLKKYLEMVEIVAPAPKKYTTEKEAM